MSVNSSISSSQQSTLAGWLMWGCAAAFYFFQFMVRVSPTVMTDELMQSFSVTAASLGTLISLYYFVYAPLQVPVGSMLDYLGPRRMATVGVALCSLGCFLFALCPNIYVAYIARMMMGAGSACAFLSCMQIATLWLPPEKFALAVGLTMALGSFGGTVAGRPLEFSIASFGWQYTLIGLGVVGFLLMFLIWLVIRDRSKPLYPRPMDTGEQSKPSLLEGFLEVAKNKQTWILNLHAFLMYTPLSVFGDLWGVPFVKQCYNISKSDAAFLAPMMYAGLIIGAPLWAWVSMRMQSRLEPMKITAFMTGLLFAIVLYFPTLPIYYLYGILLLAGVFLGGQFIEFSILTEVNRSCVSGVATGIMNACSMISGLLFQPCVGILLDICWDGTMCEGVPFYGESFRLALSMLPACGFLAFIILFFVRETYPKKHYNS